MIQPPRTIERFLHALGAEPEFRDDLLGDLAEELSIRAERDGQRNAMRWYYGEAIRSIPHLLGSWWSGLRGRAVVRLAGVVVCTYILIGLTGRVLMGVGLVALDAVDVAISTSNGIMVALGITLGITRMLLGGYVAAWLGGREALIATFALGTVRAGAGMMMFMVMTDAIPPVAIGASAIVFLGTVAGGLLRVRTAAVAR